MGVCEGTQSLVGITSRESLVGVCKGTQRRGMEEEHDLTFALEDKYTLFVLINIIVDL